MPRFYFHLFNDMDVPDEEGADFADLAAAHAFAIGQARALVADSARGAGRIVLHHRIDIENDEHRLVGSVAFRDALSIEDRGPQ